MLVGSGWVAAIVGYGVFAAVAYRSLTSTSHSTIDTPWYVPQSVEDYANVEAARIQAEQKTAAEAALMTAFGKGALAMLGVGLLLGAWTSGRGPGRTS